MITGIDFNDMFIDLFTAKLSRKTTWGRTELEKLILEAKAQTAMDIMKRMMEESK